jgi:hypothetical protein
MLHIDINNSNRKKPNKLIMLAFCAIFIVASLLSTVYIVVEADHEHDNDGPNGNCAVCFHLMSAENYPNQSFIPTDKRPAITFIAINLTNRLDLALPGIIFDTPVTLKVILNN